MISSLFEQIKSKHSFSLQEMAEVMNISLDRAKNLSTGRAKKFKPEETQILVSQLGINPNWLMTGEGEMFDTQLPSHCELSVDEEMLLSAYREMTVAERKALLQIALSKNVTDKSSNASIHNSFNGRISNSFNQKGV